MTGPRSLEAMEHARRVLPGGVDSPVRAYRAVGGSPIFVASGQGASVTDVDDRRYIDYVQSYGPLLFGHAFAPVVEAVREAAPRGTSFGAPTLAEPSLADRIIAAMPSIEMVRFVSSGTEAAMSALRVARAATGRSLVLKFEGCYHGHADGLLVAAGSGAATLAQPDSAGVPSAYAAQTIVAAYNDLDSVERAFAQYTQAIAAVIVEPIAANMGVVPPASGFLEGLRALCDRHGALLIFDEVISGFRVARGGAQALTSIRPDLTVLGKIIGGGLPVGAYGGRRALMELVAPVGPVYQAGTLSGNPLAMAAGAAMLDAIEAQATTLYVDLDAAGARLEDGLREASAAAGAPVAIARVGSVLTPFFLGHELTHAPRSWAEAKRCDTTAFARFHAAMLDGGVHLPPSQYEAWFISAAHTTDDLDRTVDVARSAFAAAGHAPDTR